MVVPFMALYLTESRHYTISQAGIVMALFGLGAIGGGILGGKLTDKLGFYRVQLAALLCGGTMFLLLGQMNNFGAICVCVFLLSILNDSFRPANATAIAEYSNEENRTRCFSLNRLSINVGWAVGSAVGGFVAAHNYQLLFWIDGLTNIGAAILLMAVLAPSRNAQTPSKNDRKAKQVQPAASPYRDAQYMFFFVLTILFGYTFFQIFSTIPLYYRKVLHVSPALIGGVMSMNGIIVAVVEMALVFTLEQRRRNLHFITMGMFCVALSFLVFNFLPEAGYLAVVSTLIFTPGEMLTMPFMNSFMISRTTPENRGQYAGLYTVAWSVAQVIGPFSGTRIADKFGFGTLWWVTGGMALAAMAGFRYLQSVTEKAASGQPD